VPGDLDGDSFFLKEQTSGNLMELKFQVKPAELMSGALKLERHSRHKSATPGEATSHLTALLLVQVMCWLSVPSLRPLLYEQ
jgi:hypothetical protein